MSLRTSAPPKAREWERKLVSRPSWTCRVETWKALATFGLEFVVVDHGVVAGDDFGYRIGEIGAAGWGLGAGVRCTLVTFNDGRLASGFRYDQRRGWLAVGWPLAEDSTITSMGSSITAPFGNVDEEAVFEVGGV